MSSFRDKCLISLNCQFNVLIHSHSLLQLTIKDFCILFLFFATNSTLAPSITVRSELLTLHIQTENEALADQTSDIK